MPKQTVRKRLGVGEDDDLVKSDKETLNEETPSIRPPVERKGKTREDDDLVKSDKETPTLIGRGKTLGIRPVVQKKEKTLWIWEDDEMIEKKITFVPLLYQVLDGMILSAVDVRYGVKHIIVHIDAADSTIFVWSHAECEGIMNDYTDSIYKAANLEGVSVLVGSNHSHGQGNKVGGGGYLVFHQDHKLWQTVRHTIKNFSQRERWCMGSFKLSLKHFDLQCLEDDMVALLKRRVVDLAACCSGVKVELYELHTTPVLPRTFKDYVELYLKAYRTHTMRICEKVNDRWEISVAVADCHVDHFHQVSFVNNIATRKGGSHVDYITNQITDYLADIVDLEPNEIKGHLWVFVNARIDHPTFDSQTKEKLTTNEDSFGSTCQLTPELLEKIADSYVFKSFERKLDIPGLKDADLADTPSSQYCTLILTRGVSSTAFAMSQLYSLGEDKYGLYPLNGKLLNVREASHAEVEKNIEIQNIKKILGLQKDKIYENVEGLRYGRLMIMADEDRDGLETKGLLINFIHRFWPSLLGKVKNFLRAFIAPIAKASHKKTKKVRLLYSMPQYEVWKEKFGEDYIIKWYKGQETIQSEEKGEYDFHQHVKDFVWENEEDGDAIELAFSPVKIEERKDWLEAPQDDTDFDATKKSIRYRDFINQEFKQYAIADIQRSTPSMVDGLKPDQRNILFCAFKKPIIQTTQVDDFCSYVLQHSPYDVEDEASLVGTIISMAQNFVGSNNVNLLQPDGRFGTRLMGGKNHAEGRFLFTRLSPITRYLFHEDDQLLLNYLIEYGQSIGHAWFIPVIPIVLVNGSEATGAWSSFIPNYNPRDVIANIERLLAGDDMVSMLPWYKEFKGDFEETKTASNHTSYTTSGKFSENTNAFSITITELPIRMWTEDYRQFLFLEAASEKDIKAYTDRSYSPTGVDFEITMTEDQMNRARQEEGGLLNKFKLTTTLSTDNMYLLDKDGLLKKYDTPQQILEDFFHIRLDFYQKRKTDLVRWLKIASLVLENKIRFINDFWEGNISLFRKSMDEKCAVLEAEGFRSLGSIVKEVDQLQGEAADASYTTRYDYLLALAIPAIGVEDIEKMEQELYEKKEKIVYLENISIEDLWREDLKALDDQLDFEGYPESKAKLARGAAGQSANKKRRMQ